MDIVEVLAPLPVGGALHVPQGGVGDTDFDARWAAWAERGRVHEQRVQRRLVVWGAVLTTGAAMIYAFLRS